MNLHSHLPTRYRNGVTNFGVVCGFATNTDDGHLHLLPTGCTEMGWLVERTPGARAAEYDFEPLMAVCQMDPPEDEWAQPRVRALYVTRMPRRLLPHKLVWMAGDWPYNSPYFPYHERFHSYNFPDSLLETLPDTGDFPDWLTRLAEEDETLAPLLEKTFRARYMPNTWLLTGRLVSGPVTEPVETAPHDTGCPYVPLKLWQPGDPSPFHLRILITANDARPFLRKSRAVQMQATVLCQARTSVLEHNNARVLRSQIIYTVDEILVPSMIDVEEQDEEAAMV